MYRRGNAWSLLEDMAERALNNTSKTATMDIEDDILTMNFDVPGLSKSDIKIAIEDKVITLEGETESRTFNKQYKLSDEWDIHQTEAKVKNGVLTLTIPKMKIQKKKVLEIIVKQGVAKGSFKYQQHSMDS